MSSGPKAQAGRSQTACMDVLEGCTNYACSDLEYRGSNILDNDRVVDPNLSW